MISKEFKMKQAVCALIRNSEGQLLACSRRNRSYVILYQESFILVYETDLTKISSSHV